MDGFHCSSFPLRPRIYLSAFPVTRFLKNRADDDAKHTHVPRRLFFHQRALDSEKAEARQTLLA
jgi:hypothetical protein